MDIDKLKVLANNGKDLLEAHKTIARREAIKQGHDMSEYLIEDWGSARGIFYTHTCNCRKCDFEIYIEQDNEQYFIDLYKHCPKCSAI